MASRIVTRSSEAGYVLRNLLRGEGLNENIARVGMRSEILHVFGMQPVVFTAALQEAIAIHGDDKRVMFFANSLNAAGDAKGLTLEDRRKESGFGGTTTTTWVRHETVAAEILSDYLLQRYTDRAINSDIAVVSAEDYNPLERELAQNKEENLRLHARISELEARLSQIHQLSSPL